MKKYVKPQLFYEEFELTKQIAACQFDLVPGTQADHGCRFEGVDKIFGEQMTIFQAMCTTSDAYVAESYCYHNSITGAYGIFNS